jgi:hypothetical protein
VIPLNIAFNISLACVLSCAVRPSAKAADHETGRHVVFQTTVTWPWRGEADFPRGAILVFERVVIALGCIDRPGRVLEGIWLDQF